MISRVANGCFWLHRHIERVESLARMLYVRQAFVLGVNLERRERWLPLVIVLGEEQRFRARMKDDGTDDGEATQQFLVWERENPVSISSSIYWARENARTIRETISLEMWETVNGLWLWFNSRAAKTLYEKDRYRFYLELRNRCTLYCGFAQSTMLHGEAFDFMELGTALERTNQTGRILDINHHLMGRTNPKRETPRETAQWLAILRSCSGAEPFFKRGSYEVSGRSIATFLLFDRQFPRSVLHNVEGAARLLYRVRPKFPARIGYESAKRLDELVNELAEMEIGMVLERGIHTVLTWIVDSTAEICAAIHQDFFDPARVVPAKPGRTQSAQSSQVTVQPS